MLKRGKWKEIKCLFYTCEIYLSLYQFTYKGQRTGRKEGHCFLCTQGKKSKSPQRTPVLSDSTTRSLSCHCISCCCNKTRNTDIVINFEMKERYMYMFWGNGSPPSSRTIGSGPRGERVARCSPRALPCSQDIFWLSGIETDKTDFVVWQMIGAITHSAFCPSRFSQTLSDSSPAYKDAN